jgi:hypothetical protein
VDAIIGLPPDFFAFWLLVAVLIGISVFCLTLYDEEVRRDNLKRLRGINDGITRLLYYAVLSSNVMVLHAHDG